MRPYTIEGISPNLQKGMTWLAKTFSSYLNDPAQEAEDIYHDLIVVYYEKKDTIKTQPKNPDNWWFIIFKNYLINKAIGLKMEQEIQSSLNEFKTIDEIEDNNA